MPFLTKEEKQAYNKAYYQANKHKYKCEHNRQKGHCRECGGSNFCEHKKEKIACKECGGISICKHNKQKCRCKECGGGSICQHNRVKQYCRECGGSSFCEHNRIKRQCKECISVNNYLIVLQRVNLNRIIKSKTISKTKSSIEYLGCSAEYFIEYLEKKMTDGMNFDNIHLDHIKPVSKFDLENMDELLDCCHYSNFQPLFGSQNISKGNKWNECDEIFWNENIKGKEYMELYIPN